VAVYLISYFCGSIGLSLLRASEKGNDDEEFRSYGPFGARLYPAWIASCSIMYLPFLVVP
jgi:hypothetical protein